MLQHNRLGLRFFRAPLPDSITDKMIVYGLISTIFEDLPQLAIQLQLIADIGAAANLEVPSTTYVALVTTVLALILAFLKRTLLIVMLKRMKKEGDNDVLEGDAAVEMQLCISIDVASDARASESVAPRHSVGVELSSLQQRRSGDMATCVEDDDASHLHADDDAASRASSPRLLAIPITDATSSGAALETASALASASASASALAMEAALARERDVEARERMLAERELEFAASRDAAMRAVERERESRERMLAERELEFAANRDAEQRALECEREALSTQMMQIKAEEITNDDVDERERVLAQKEIEFASSRDAEKRVLERESEALSVQMKAAQSTSARENERQRAINKPTKRQTSTPGSQADCMDDNGGKGDGSASNPMNGFLLAARRKSSLFEQSPLKKLRQNAK
jgi:hypothetical protein